MTDFDVWLYPEDLGFDGVINLFRDDGEIQTNEYKLPDNWKDIVTQNKGEDGKKSIHDIMIEIHNDYSDVKPYEICAGCGKKMDMYDTKVKPRPSLNPEGLYYCPGCEPEEVKK